MDDVRAVDLYVRLVSALDREVDGDFLVSMCMYNMIDVTKVLAFFSKLSNKIFFK